MNDKLKFYAGTIAFMLSVITIIGRDSLLFSRRLRMLRR